MKKLFLLLVAFVVSSTTYAGTICAYAYEPSKLLGTEYANDFRRAKESQQPLNVSLEKAVRLVKQCRPALIGQQRISTTQDENFLQVLSSGRIQVQLEGTSMLMAPMPAGSEQLNLNPENGVVYYVLPSEGRPNGVFILAYEEGGAQL